MGFSLCSLFIPEPTNVFPSLGRPCLQRWVWQSVKMEELWGSFLLKRYKRHDHQGQTLMENLLIITSSLLFPFDLSHVLISSFCLSFHAVTLFFHIISLAIQAHLMTSLKPRRFVKLNWKTKSLPSSRSSSDFQHKCAYFCRQNSPIILLFIIMFTQTS